MKTSQTILFLLLLLLGISSFSPQAPTPISEAAKKGKQIFNEGKSPSGGKIVALMSGVEVPAAVMTCSSCHGTDGKGRKEGGVVPSNITWPSLTANYKGERSSKRSHPAYTEKLAKRAITMGFDPAGNKLNAMMPRYQMSHEDLENLMAYLKVLGLESEMGVYEKQINIGIYPRGKNVKREAAEKAVVKAYFEEINAAGGIFGRTLSLHETADTPTFAWLNSPPDAPPENNQAPIIGAIGQPITDFTQNRGYFYLLPGVKELTFGFADWLKKRKQEKLAIIYDENSQGEDLAKILEKQLTKEVLLLPIKETTDLKKTLQAVEISQLFVFLSPQAEQELITVLKQQTKIPALFFLGKKTHLYFTNLPPIFDQKVHLINPTWITVPTTSGLSYYSTLQTKYKLARSYKLSQFSTLTSVMLLVEILKKCGRDLKQETLIKELEKTYKWESGLLPPLTFGPNRRVGSERVYVVRVGEGELELLE